MSGEGRVAVGCAGIVIGSIQPNNTRGKNFAELLVLNMAIAVLRMSRPSSSRQFFGVTGFAVK